MRVVVGWYRRWVGLTALEEDLAAADARILELEAERDEALEMTGRLRARLDAAASQRADDVAALGHLRDRYQLLAGRLGTAEDNARRSAELVESLLEPGQVDGCRKIRLRDEAEAQAFGEQLAADMGGYESRTYQCKVCPRHPVTLERFWHIASASKGLSGESGRIRRARDRGRSMLAGPDGLRTYALRDALADRLDSAG